MPELSDDDVAATRAHLLREVGDHLRSLATLQARNRDAEADAAEPFRAIAVTVAQFPGDAADDEVHVELIGSPSAEPTGLHRCFAGRDVCRWCAERHVLDARALFGELDVVPALEAFCADGGNELAEHADVYRVWATVRLDGAALSIDTEPVVRPWLDLPTRAAELLGLDHRALEVSLGILGNRHAIAILADLLQELRDPRGDALATARRRSGARPDVARRARSARASIGSAAARRRTRRDRGCISPATSIATSACRSRFAQPSASCPAVRARSGRRSHPARALGPLDAAALQSIAAGTTSFAAEHVEITSDALADFSRENLPRLRTLRVVDVTLADLERLRRLDLGELELLELGLRIEDPARHAVNVATWRHAELPVPVAIGMFDPDAERACGWWTLPDGSVVRRGFHRLATDALRLELSDR